MLAKVVPAEQESNQIRPKEGKPFRPVSVGQCRTCRSEHRAEIEEYVISRLLPVHIVAKLPEDAGVSERNILEHVRRGHLPVDQAEVADHLAYRTWQLQVQICSMSTAAAKEEVNTALLKVAAGAMRLRDGQWEVKGHEVIQAMKVLAMYEGHADELRRVEERARQDDDARMSQIEDLFVIVGEVCGTAMLGQVIQRAACSSPLSSALIDPRLAQVHDDPARPDHPNIELLADPHDPRLPPSMRATHLQRTR